MFVLEVISTIAASWFFLPLMLLGFCLLSLLVEQRCAVWSTILTTILLILAGGAYPEVVKTLRSNPLLIGVAVGTYFAIGAAWAFYKWFLTLSKVRARFIQAKDEFIQSENIRPDFLKAYCQDEVDRQIISKFAHKLKAAGLLIFTTDLSAKIDRGDFDAELIIQEIKPRIDAHKKDALLWIGYWPASAAWFALHDVLREMKEFVYIKIRGKLQKMSDRMFENVA